ncbi:MAG: hypothetical protein JXA90_11675 [Planctomycetes bacterium]|nr:hypothetical protein [Planctomycetota bacterium]
MAGSWCEHSFKLSGRGVAGWAGRWRRERRRFERQTAERVEGEPTGGPRCQRAAREAGQVQRVVEEGALSSQGLEPAGGWRL